MLFINVRSNSTILKDILKLEKLGNIKLNSSEKLLLINTGTTEQVLQVFSNALTKILILKQIEKKNTILRTVNIISNDQNVLVSASSIIYLNNLPDKIIFELRKGKKGSRVAKLIDSPNLPDGEAAFMVETAGLRDF